MCIIELNIWETSVFLNAGVFILELVYVSELLESKDHIEMILSSLLSKCVKVFSSFEAERKRIIEEQKGNKYAVQNKHLSLKKPIKKIDIPPEDAIVKYQLFRDSSLETVEEKKWHLQNCRLSPIDDIRVKRCVEPESGMYFNQALFKIAIDTHQNIAHFSFSMGPLFGRGFKIKIEYIDGVPYLGEENLVWMS